MAMPSPSPTRVGLAKSEFPSQQLYRSRKISSNVILSEAKPSSSALREAQEAREILGFAQKDVNSVITPL